MQIYKYQKFLLHDYPLIGNKISNLVAKNEIQSNDTLKLVYRLKLGIQLFFHYTCLLKDRHRMKEEDIRTAVVAAVTGLSLDCQNLVHCF